MVTAAFPTIQSPTCFTFLLIVWHDDVAVAVWVVLGYVINIALSFSLNQIIYQDRRLDFEVASGPGMPSFHSQSISFTLLVKNADLEARTKGCYDNTSMDMDMDMDMVMVVLLD
ncbi:hypothetical protein L6452_02465 [Arctium lappa]|uniref:Uncharacterized protein n=1 Tax=Arctium lappa TaxID=4217 RepID=A0ACB9FKH9_ARCLA|nr:hypothetical protein L6452_02465 [Arctium lappa]